MVENEVLKQREKFIKEHGLDFEKHYLSEEENDEMNILYSSASDSRKNELIKEYGYDYIDNVRRFYKKLPYSISEDQLNSYINIRMVESMEQSNQKLGTIRAILVFWLVTGIIGLLIALISIRQG